VSTLQSSVLHLDVPTLQEPELHLDVSGQQESELLLDVSTPQRSAICMHLDVSMLRSPGRAVLHLDVCSLRGLSCTGRVYTLQNSVLHLDMPNLQERA
jgi:hypothetical protein